MRSRWAATTPGWRDSRGSVSVLFAGIVGAIALLLGGVLAASHVLVAKHSLLGAADAAALAAADVASGLVAGAPCPAAARLAAAQGAAVEACRIEGDTVTVRVTASVGIVPLSAVATAGQPSAIHGPSSVSSKK